MKSFYRPEIDGLRAIAVVSVILYHAQISFQNYTLFKGGFIGVDIFFVISGYLITSIILKEIFITGEFKFKYFYERRIRRILPALLIVMLASLPFAWIYLTPISIIDFSKSILYSLGFSSNFYFHYSGQQYGVQSSYLIPFMHTWSLSIEEQYYILFPLIIVFIIKFFKKYLIHTLILIFIISLILADWGSKNYPSLNFYILPTRGWELLAGSILAYYEVTLGRRSKNQTLNLIMPIIGFLLIGYSILFFNDKMFHPSFYSVIPIIGVCLIIWFSDKFQFFTKILSTKLLVGIGLISYSLYLWHYPIFAFLRNYSWVWKNTEQPHFIYLKYGSIFLIVILSIFTYFFIEKVFRNKKINFYKLSIVILIKILILVVFNIYVIYFDGIQSRFHPFLSKYKNEHGNFKMEYNYNNFDQRKNVFLIGNSYSEDLLNLLYYNDELNEKYYFYTAFNNDSSYQIKCLNNFFKKNTNFCKKKYFNLLKKQYAKSDFVIFAQKDNSFYLKNEFVQIVKFLKEDNKNFLIYLNDVNGADILDTFLMKNKKIPNLHQLNKLEKKLFINSKNYEGRILNKVKNNFSDLGISYITRSELLCNYTLEICALIRNNDKIYSDTGHLTDNGAKSFSLQGNKIMNKF
jgi:peptidoglycan/LPS O-acetylase OafA/YrhL